MGMTTPSVAINTLGAGEDQARKWNRNVSGATQGATTLSGKVDQLLGVSGAVGDYLHRIRATVNTSANSQVVLKVGNPAALIGTLTVAVGSTTTSIVTSANASAVTADQYKDCIVKVGGVYRRILTHIAFSTAAANTYTLDHALTAVPTTGGAIRIEDPQLVFEVLPAGAPVGVNLIQIDEQAIGAGWYLSSDTGVTLRATGQFT